MNSLFQSFISSVPHCETLTSQTVRFYPPRCPTVQVAVASVILCKQNLELWPPTNSPTPTTQAALCIFSHHPFPVSDKAQTQTGAQRQRADWNKRDVSSVIEFYLPNSAVLGAGWQLEE